MQGISLCQKYQDYFSIGAAVSEETIKAHGELLKYHFNSLTAENAMKFQTTNPKERVYDFRPADPIAGFAKENQMRLRGHTFVWHRQTPDWVFQEGGNPRDKQEVLGFLSDHIRTVGIYFRDKAYCWDVVNEAISDEPGEYLRDTLWRRALGDGYIETAFRTAREHLPDAQLFYNDYNTYQPEKREKICRLIRGLKERDVPIDGLGMQGHWGIGRPAIDEIRQTLDIYAGLGVRLQITELDISVYDHGDPRTDLTVPGPGMLDRQAEYYGKLFELFREYREQIDAVTFWGIADDATWLDQFPVQGRKDWPLLFDTQGRPKKAFDAVTNF